MENCLAEKHSLRASPARTDFLATHATFRIAIGLLPAQETSIEVKLDFRVPHVVSAGDDGIVLRDSADERTIQTGLNKSWTCGFSRVSCFKPRSSERRS